MTDAEHAPAKLRRAPAEKAARAVLPACAGAWAAAEIMHVTGVPWLDIALGSAAAAGAAYGRGYRNTGAGILLAGGWSALAARLGPTAGPYWPVTDAWALLSLWGWRWACRHPAVTQARDKRFAAADWLERRHRWGLDGTHLLDWEETRLGEWYLVDTRGTGRRASQIANSDAAERIAEDELLPLSRVQLRRHGLAGRVEISVRRIDPWAKPIPHPVLDEDPEIDLSGPCTCRKPFTVGQEPETGRTLDLPVWDEDGGKRVLIVATSRAGKTVLLNNLRERATKARDVLLVDLNLSKALEDKEWAPACHLTALTRHQAGRAMKILRILNAAIEWRSQQPRGTAVFQPSPEHPLILLIGDEIDALSRYPAARQLLRDIFSKGGSEGVAPVIAGQRGTAEWIGGSDVRALVDVFAIGLVQRRAEAMHAAGDLGLEMPDMSTYGEGRKGVWGVAELGGGTQTGRTFLLKEPGDLRKLAEDRAMEQPDLEPELKAFLGDSYENLLKTDAFARWAAERQGRPAVIAHPRPDMTPEPGLAAGTAPAPAPVAVLTDDPLAALDAEAEEYMDTLDGAAPLRRRWLEQGRRNDEARRQLAETAAMPVPDISHDDQVSHAEGRWRQLGEKTVIPDGHREQMLRLLAAGKISAGKIAEVLEVSPHTARCYVERLRIDGLARPEGKGRAAGWVAAQPAEDGDGK